VETTRTSNATTVKNLDTISRIAGTLTNLAEVTNDLGNNSTLLLTHDDSSVQNDVWYFELSASNYMCGKKELFMKLTGVHGSVSLEDSSKLPVEGKGKIKIYQKNGKLEYIFVIIFLT